MNSTWMGALTELQRRDIAIARRFAQTFSDVPGYMTLIAKLADLLDTTKFQAEYPPLTIVEDRPEEQKRANGNP